MALGDERSLVGTTGISPAPPADADVGTALSELVIEHGPGAQEVKAAWVRRVGAVVYEGGKPLLVEDVVEGIGEVNALCRWWSPAFHTGTVRMFEREGFRAIGTVPRASRRRSLARTGADDLQRFAATRLVMQKRI